MTHTAHRNASWVKWVACVAFIVAVSASFTAQLRGQMALAPLATAQPASPATVGPPLTQPSVQPSLAPANGAVNGRATNNINTESLSYVQPAPASAPADITQQNSERALSRIAPRPDTALVFIAGCGWTKPGVPCQSAGISSRAALPSTAVPLSARTVLSPLSSPLKAAIGARPYTAALTPPMSGRTALAPPLTINVETRSTTAASTSIAPDVSRSTQVPAASH